MFMTGCTNYPNHETAYRVFRMLPAGTYAALDSATITYLQTKPVQHGQVEFKGSNETMYLIVD